MSAANASFERYVAWLKRAALTGCVDTSMAGSSGPVCGTTSGATGMPATEAHTVTGAETDPKKEPKTEQKTEPHCDTPCDGRGRLIFLSLDVEPWGALQPYCRGCPVLKRSDE